MRSKVKNISKQKDKTIKYLRKDINFRTKITNKILELLESNEKKLNIEVELSKKKDRIIKWYSRDRLKCKEKSKLVEEATQILEDEIQNIRIQKNDLQQ